MNTLCATDFSPAAAAATEVAAGLTARARGRLILLHVVQPPALDVPLLPLGSSGWEVAMRQTAERRLEDMAAPLRARGLAVDARVLFGTPAPAIVDAAHARGVDLVVLGTHGRHGLSHVLLGSVAERTAETAHAPVLVVPAGSSRLAYDDGTQPLRVLLAADGAHAATAARDALAALCTSALPGSEISVVRLLSPFEEAARYGIDQPWEGDSGAMSPELVPLVERDLARWIAPLAETAAVTHHLHVVRDDPTHDLGAQVAALAPDLVVVGVGRSHAMSPWRALRADAVLRGSRVPVLCVPDHPIAPRELPRLRSVLVPTDLSDLGNLAIPHGYGLLASGGGRVELCHVHEQAASPLRPTALKPPLGQSERAAIEAQLRGLAPRDSEALGIETGVCVVEGMTAAQAIVQTAERLDVDAIALGTHARTGPSRAVKGSVAETVARTASRPVLLVHAPH